MLDIDKANLEIIIRLTDILEGTGTLSMRDARDIRTIATTAKETMEESFERGCAKADSDNSA